MFNVLRYSKGLNSDDYDASRWDARRQLLGDPTAAQFDAALTTVCVMRYISDLAHRSIYSTALNGPGFPTHLELVSKSDLD